MAERAAALFNQNPGLGDYLRKLDIAGADWALSGGAAAYVIAGVRLPSDVDVTVTDDSVDAAVAASPEDAQPHVGPEIFVCGDELHLDFPARGLSFAVGELAVDVMDTGEARNRGHVYNLGLSELALKHRLELHVDRPDGPQVVYIANPFDIVAMKAVLQRGPDMNKFDFLDIEAVLLAIGIDPEYAAARSLEIGLTDRELRVLGRAGLLASIGSARA